MINLLHKYCKKNKNVFIRPLDKNDIESLRKWRNDKTNTIFLSSIPYITKEMQNNWYENYLHREDELIFAIEEMKLFNRIVGSLSLYNIENGKCTFGKLLIGDKATRKHGIGKLAMEAAIDVAINQLKVTIITLDVYKENDIAFNLYKNMGFSVINEHEDKFGRKEYTMEYRKN